MFMPGFCALYVKIMPNRLKNRKGRENVNIYHMFC